MLMESAYQKTMNETERSILEKLMRKEVIRMKAKSIFSITGLAIMVVAAFVLTSCSGNGSSSSSTATPVAMMGTVLTDNGLTVNGTSFDASSATVSSGGVARDPGFLDNGMTVKLKGRMNEDGLSGIADRIKVVLEVRGGISSIGTDSLMVLGQTILVNGMTVFADTPGLTALKVGDKVEVHGLRDSSGAIMATRIKLLAPEQQAIDEVRGLVSNTTATTFDIGGLTVTFNADTIVEPAGAAFGDGDIVKVHLNGTTAVLIEVERLADAEFIPEEGQEFEIEGFISGFTDPAADFLVGDQTVRLASDAEFRGGDIADLGDNVMVEAEGLISGGVLLADKIKFKDTIRIEANADTNGSADVLGKTVAVSSATRLNHLPGGLADILAGDGLKIRGFLSQDGSTIMATRVQKHSHPFDPDKILLQGPVSAFDATPGAEKLVIAGITVTISGVQADDLEHEGRRATLDEIFASIVPDRTIVKARGLFSDGILAANKLEIEGE
jgi:hypothetical protein